VWNEPDLFGKFTINGEKNYLTLYQHAASGAGRAGNVNSFKFGGPATTDLYKNWFDSLLQFCQKNNVRLDFFSWHKYSNDLGEYEDEVKNVKSWVSAFPSFANLEFDVTENGIDPKNDPAYDGGLSAIQTIASTAVLQGTVRRSFLFELKDGPGEAQYWGRWGILTNQKYGDPAAKPRFNAVLFLNNMIGDNLLVAGQGTWVKAFAKKDESGKVRVLVVNFDPVGSHQEAVPIRISKLTNGEYTVKRIDFGGGIRTRPTTVASNVIDITETFNANTTAIIEISHQ
jgi:beta-xylosidase